jgi:hypothetical protein
MSDLLEPVVVAEGTEYALFSNAEESAFVLRHKAENSSAFLEGDELAAFLRDYQSVKDQYPGYDADQILAQLWDQGGYSWMAGPDEG